MDYMQVELLEASQLVNIVLECADMEQCYKDMLATASYRICNATKHLEQLKSQVGQE